MRIRSQSLEDLLDEEDLVKMLRRANPAQYEKLRMVYCPNTCDDNEQLGTIGQSVKKADLLKWLDLPPGNEGASRPSSESNRQQQQSTQSWEALSKGWDPEKVSIMEWDSNWEARSTQVTRCRTSDGVNSTSSTQHFRQANPSPPIDSLDLENVLAFSQHEKAEPSHYQAHTACPLPKPQDSMEISGNDFKQTVGSNSSLRAPMVPPPSVHAGALGEPPDHSLATNMAVHDDTGIGGENVIDEASVQTYGARLSEDPTSHPRRPPMYLISKASHGHLQSQASSSLNNNIARPDHRPSTDDKCSNGRHITYPPFTTHSPMKDEGNPTPWLSHRHGDNVITQALPTGPLHHVKSRAMNHLLEQLVDDESARDDNETTLCRESDGTSKVNQTRSRAGPHHTTHCISAPDERRKVKSVEQSVCSSVCINGSRIEALKECSGVPLRPEVLEIEKSASRQCLSRNQSVEVIAHVHPESNGPRENSGTSILPIVRVKESSVQCQLMPQLSEKATMTLAQAARRRSNVRKRGNAHSPIRTHDDCHERKRSSGSIGSDISSLAVSPVLKQPCSRTASVGRGNSCDVKAESEIEAVSEATQVQPTQNQSSQEKASSSLAAERCNFSNTKQARIGDRLKPVRRKKTIDLRVTSLNKEPKDIVLSEGTDAADMQKRLVSAPAETVLSSSNLRLTWTLSGATVAQLRTWGLRVNHSRQVECCRCSKYVHTQIYEPTAFKIAV